jgi:hypothetical protein
MNTSFLTGEYNKKIGEEEFTNISHPLKLNNNFDMVLK